MSGAWNQWNYTSSGVVCGRWEDEMRGNVAVCWVVSWQASQQCVAVVHVVQHCETRQWAARWGTIAKQPMTVLLVCVNIVPIRTATWRTLRGGWMSLLHIVSQCVMRRNEPHYSSSVIVALSGRRLAVIREATTSTHTHTHTHSRICRSAQLSWHDDRLLPV